MIKIDVVFVGVIMFLSTSAFCQKVKPANNSNITPFHIEINNSDYSEAYSILFILSNKSLEVVFKGGLKNEKDSILLNKKIPPSDALRIISEINLAKLKNYYSNDCIQDGSQLTVRSIKKDKQKIIQVSNYYQSDIGEIIYFVNNLVPAKYKIWYDKAKLLTDQKKCQ